MQRVFTVMRASQDPNVLLFGVDAEESLENHGHIGEVYRAKKIQRRIIPPSRC